MCVTVIVCTHQRPTQLQGCLESLRTVSEADVSFLIVDNAPSDEATRGLVAAATQRDHRFTYLHEPRTGLSRARNAGLREADGEIVAFVDDDVRPALQWLEGIRKGFERRADVACVTGPVVSASLNRPAEQYFEERVWWSASGGSRVFDAEHAPGSPLLHPYAAGTFGTGANMAFKTRVLRALGGFDEALGAGTPTGGGEDLDVFVRTIRGGHAIAYEPSAVVTHLHRIEVDELSVQMCAYGRGLSAYLFKYLTSRETMLDLARRMPHGVRHLQVLSGRAGNARRTSGLPRSLLWAELRGLAAGPAAYIRATRRQDPMNRTAVAP